MGASGSKSSSDAKLLKRKIVHIFRGILVMVRGHQTTDVEAVTDHKKTDQYRLVSGGSAFAFD